ncbi:MAG: serine/threonine-protein kinase, partial [Candidatus Nanoarchaeia archaeon]
IHALLNEAAIGKSFGKHPHLIPVVDYGNCGDEYFSAMEFVEGKRLDQIIDEKITVSQKFAMLWGLQLLSAEQRIYDCGYLFRDIKPQNIIIDKNRNARLFDYGLCMPIETAAQINSSETVEGSPIYMPPERIVGYPEAMNSEIYSIGMVLFHLLAGKPYYSAEDAYNLAKKHVASIRVANVASRMPKNISTEITKLIDKMIARNPQERFQTYKEVACEMNRIFNSLKQ